MRVRTSKVQDLWNVNKNICIL